MEASLRSRTVMRRVNERKAQSLAGPTPIAFSCECDDRRCVEPVWMFRETFETGKLDPSWSVLAPGHSAAPDHVEISCGAV